jgi:DNA-binding CsgD family transcriptional regulator
VEAPQSARDDLPSVVRRLIDLARSESSWQGLTDSAELVLVDLACEGIRCLVVARPASGAEHSLSPREREIVRIVAQGYPNKTIASVLEISSWTVSTYMRRIFAKLDVRSRAAMVARAIEEGLVSQSAADLATRPPGRRIAR